MSASVKQWDGHPATKCDHKGCTNALVLHIELTTPGADYGAEGDLCEEHLPDALKQARAFLVLLSVIEPADETEQNLRTVASEHSWPR